MDLITKVSYITRLNNRELIDKKEIELYNLWKKTGREDYADAYKYLEYVLHNKKYWKLRKYGYHILPEELFGVHFSSLITEDIETLTVHIETFLFHDVNPLEMDINNIFPNMNYHIKTSNPNEKKVEFKDDYNCFFITVWINKHTYIKLDIHFDKGAFPYYSQFIDDLADIYFFEDIFRSLLGFFNMKFTILENYWMEECNKRNKIYKGVIKK